MTEKSQPRDALNAFRTIQNTHSGEKFASGEHEWLGKMGLFAACKTLGISRSPFMNLARSDGSEEFSYGELVALSGDFYGSPKELFEEKPSPLPWLYEGNDLSDLRKIFAEELDWIENENRPANVGYPENSVALAWNAKSYVELALENTDHFAWHNIVAYCRYHREALELAHEAKTIDTNNYTWRRAVFYNAFADHFLTDSFAAGHVRVPRAEITVWAKKQGYNKMVSGGLSKLLHDQDGHINTLHAHGEKIAAHEGLHVMNSLGSDWFTRCDGQLFIATPTQEDYITEPVQAVAASFSELVSAANEQILPDGKYKALCHVPFPHSSLAPLSEKFGPDVSDSKIEELIAGIKWFEKIPWVGPGVNLNKVRMLFDALPEIMSDFRTSVSESYDANSELQKRLPEQYVQAFRTIS